MPRRRYNRGRSGRQSKHSFDSNEGKFSDYIIDSVLYCAGVAPEDTDDDDDYDSYMDSRYERSDSYTTESDESSYDSSEERRRRKKKKKKKKRSKSKSTNKTIDPREAEPSEPNLDGFNKYDGGFNQSQSQQFSQMSSGVQPGANLGAPPGMMHSPLLGQGPMDMAYKYQLENGNKSPPMQSYQNNSSRMLSNQDLQENDPQKQIEEMRKQIEQMQLEIQSSKMSSQHQQPHSPPMQPMQNIQPLQHLSAGYNLSNPALNTSYRSNSKDQPMAVRVVPNLPKTQMSSTDAQFLKNEKEPKRKKKTKKIRMKPKPGGVDPPMMHGMTSRPTIVPAITLDAGTNQVSNLRMGSMYDQQQSNNSLDVQHNQRQQRLAHYKNATNLNTESVRALNTELVMENKNVSQTVLPAGEAGLSISKTAAGLTILRIADNSIARDLKPGDIIIGLDGVDITKFSSNVVMQLLSKRKHRQRTISFERGEPLPGNIDDSGGRRQGQRPQRSGSNRRSRG